MPKKKYKKKKLSLNKKYYQKIVSEDIYSEEKRIAKAFGARNKKTNELSIKLLSESKRPWGWKQNLGFTVYSAFHIDKLFASVRNIAKKIGWNLDEDHDIESIKKRLREKEELIVELEQRNDEARIEHELLIKEYNKKERQILDSRLPEFEKAVRELEEKIKGIDKKTIQESELQEFLYNNYWLFGAEYISSQPQKFRGAKSRFDFYLERFNKTNDIVEIKLISDNIMNKDGSISAKVVQAVDQIIEYMESATAAAHSVPISEEEGIRELRPRGMIIIGNDNSDVAKKKLHKWNYQFSHIQIFTYTDILEKGKALVKNIQKEGVKDDTKN